MSDLFPLKMQRSQLWGLRAQIRKLNYFLCPQQPLIHVFELFTATISPVADSTNLPSILSTIAARRHSFFGHICRLSAHTPAHNSLKLAVDSKSGDIPQHDWNRPAGRPWTTWMSQIVRDTGLAAADAWALADDRSTWRALRPTAGYAQQ